MNYIKSGDNLADPFTKGLPRDEVLKSSKGMGLLPMTKKMLDRNPTNEIGDPKMSVQRDN